MIKTKIFKVEMTLGPFIYSMSNCMFVNPETESSELDIYFNLFNTPVYTKSIVLVFDSHKNFNFSFFFVWLVLFSERK